jgi:NAD(P)-dependent dehydrogenase (short-subunit alcohol dehydrogenase family)
MVIRVKYLYGKSMLITGGSSGIGLAVAELFAANGFTVFAASRNPPPEIRNFPGGGVIHPITMDVCDPQSVDNAVKDTLAQADIGIVVHSAGIGIACPAEDYPSEMIASLFETNFIGVLRVNGRLLPHMRERGGGICVIVSSVASVYPIPFQSHYCASKAALDLYAATLRMELRDYGVIVSLVMPGDTNTAFTSARKYEIDKASPYYGACINAVGKMEKDELGGRPPESVARVILKLCIRKNPPLRKIVGFEYKVFTFARRLLPDRLAETILRSMYMKRKNTSMEGDIWV